VWIRGWRARRDSNSRPLGPQPNALSTELRARAKGLAEREGFEPSEQVTPLGGLANRCTRPLCDLSVQAPGIIPALTGDPVDAGPCHPLPSAIRGPPSIAVPARHVSSRRLKTRGVRVVPGEQRFLTSAFLLPSQRRDS